MAVRHFIAAKAFIRHNGKILVLRESGSYADGLNQGRYDVPGGRLDDSETLIDGLKREVFEECGLTVETAVLFFKNDVSINKEQEEWRIMRHYFACDAADAPVTLGTDHDRFEWIDPTAHAQVALIDDLHAVFAAYLTKSDSAS